MENKTEVVDPQNNQQEVVPSNKVELTVEELADLKHKAEVSSQNFERLKKAEDKIRELENNNINNTQDNDVYSDEGKLLKKELDAVRGEMSSLKEERELERIYAQYPLLKEKSADFETFRAGEHPRAKIESVAKLYLAENGLLETTRKGLESPTGGSRTPMTSGMTNDEVKNLRETNYKKYMDMLKKDQIKMS